jgi:hypothetical protein
MLFEACTIWAAGADLDLYLLRHYRPTTQVTVLPAEQAGEKGRKHCGDSVKPQSVRPGFHSPESAYSEPRYLGFELRTLGSQSWTIAFPKSYPRSPEPAHNTLRRLYSGLVRHYSK